MPTTATVFGASTRTIIVLLANPTPSDTLDVQTFKEVSRFQLKDGSVFLVETTNGRNVFLSKALVRALFVVENDADQYYSCQLPSPEGSASTVKAIQDMLGQCFPIYLTQQKIVGTRAHPQHFTRFRVGALDINTYQEVSVHHVIDQLFSIRGIPSIAAWINSQLVPTFEIQQVLDWNASVASV